MLNKHVFYIQIPPIHQDISKSNFDTEANNIFPATYFGYKRLHFVVVTDTSFSQEAQYAPTKTRGWLSGTGPL